MYRKKNVPVMNKVMTGIIVLCIVFSMFGIGNISFASVEGGSEAASESTLSTGVKANTDRSKRHAIYANPYNPNPDQAIQAVSRAFEADLRLKAISPDGNDEYSSTAWDHSTAGNQSASNVANAGDIYDLDSKNPSIVGSITGKQSGKLSFLLDFTNMSISESAQDDLVQINSTNPQRIVYKYNNEYYSLEELKKQDGFSWNKVKQIWLRDTSIDKGDLITFNIPVTINSGSSSLTIRDYSSHPQTKTYHINISAQKYEGLKSSLTGIDQNAHYTGR